MTNELRPAATFARAPSAYNERDQNELRRAIAQALDTVTIATGTSGLEASLLALPSLAALTSADELIVLDEGLTASRVTAALSRDYILGISGGTATIPENVSITQNLTVNGNTTLGNATSDTITATARFASVLTPSTANTRDLGDSSLPWRTGYFGTSLGVGFTGALASGVNLDIVSQFGVRPSGSGYPTAQMQNDLGGRFYAIHTVNDWGFVIGRAQNDNGWANVALYHTRNSNAATRTALTNGDGVGRITFQGVSSSTVTNVGAAIATRVNGTVSSGTLPTQLEFYTVSTGDAMSGASNDNGRRWIISPAGDLLSESTSINIGATGQRVGAIWGTTATVTTSVTTATSVATTRVTSPLIGTTTATNVVFDRNSVTQLTLGSLVATFAGAIVAAGTVTGVTDLTASGTIQGSTLIGTTRVTAPLLGTTTNTDVVFDRNSVTQLTLGSLLATFAGAVAINGAFSGATTGAFSSNVTIGGTLGVTGNVTVGTGAVLHSTSAKITLDGTDGVVAAGSIGFAETGGSLEISSRGSVRVFIDNDNNGTTAIFGVFANENVASASVFSVSELGSVAGGTYNGQTISGAASFTGTVAVTTSITSALGIFTTSTTGQTLSVTNTASGGGEILLATRTSDSAAQGASWIGRRSRSTGGAVNNNDALAGIYAQGHDGTSFYGINVGAIRILAAETHTTGPARGSKIDFATTLIGAATRTVRGTITDAGLFDWDYAMTVDGTFTANGAVSLSPANANVVLSPTGTGLVTINPATAGTMNNVVIGASTPLAGTFTTATAANFVANPSAGNGLTINNGTSTTRAAYINGTVDAGTLLGLSVTNLSSNAASASYFELNTDPSGTVITARGGASKGAFNGAVFGSGSGHQLGLITVGGVKWTVGVSAVEQGSFVPFIDNYSDIGTASLRVKAYYGYAATLYNGLIVNEAGGNFDTRMESDGLTHALFIDASEENIALVSGSAPSWNAMEGGLFIANASVVPTGNPTGGGYLYAEGGALKWRGSGGTITTMGPA